MTHTSPGPLECCWLTALRLSWHFRLNPEAGRVRLRRMLAPMGLSDSVDAFIALITGLAADGVRCLDIRALDAPGKSGDEAALLDGLSALCLDDPLEAEQALAGLFPPGRGQTSLRLLNHIAAQCRRQWPRRRMALRPFGARVH